jgi:hypothetical protein
MHLRARPFTLLFLSLFILAKLNAGALTWDGGGRISVRVMEGKQKKVRVIFAYRNAGHQPVTITTVKTDCECVTALLPTDTCSAGKKAMVIVTFDLAGLTGPQEKTITVTTNEPDQPPAQLHLQVNIKKETD